MLEEVTFEGGLYCEELKGKHSRQRGHRYKQGSVCVRTRRDLF